MTLQHLHIQSPQESWTVKKNQNKYYLLYILSPTNTSHISSQWGLVSNCACNKPKPKICGGNYGWKGKVWAVAPSTGGPHAREHALCRTSCTSCFRLFRNHIWRTTLSDQSHPQRWRHCREDETRSPLQTGHHRPLPCSKALDLPTKQVFGQQPLGQNLNRHPSILDYWMLALGQRTKKKGRTQIHKTSWYPNPVCWKGLVTKKILGNLGGKRRPLPPPTANAQCSSINSESSNTKFRTRSPKKKNKLYWKWLWVTKGAKMTQCNLLMAGLSSLLLSVNEKIQHNTA